MTTNEFHQKLTDLGFGATRLDPVTFYFYRSRGRIQLNVERLENKVMMGDVTYDQIYMELCKVIAADDQGIKEDDLITVVDKYRKDHGKAEDREDSFSINR